MTASRGRTRRNDTRSFRNGGRSACVLPEFWPTNSGLLPRPDGSLFGFVWICTRSERTTTARRTVVEVWSRDGRRLALPYGASPHDVAALLADVGALG